MIRRCALGSGVRIGRVVLFILAALIATDAPIIRASTYYIFPAGFDDDRRTEARPWRRIQNAAETCPSGKLARGGRGA
jgi:hypothetical protein